jgi:glycosyltransferase involved in cell wall biosynthesis
VARSLGFVLLYGPPWAGAAQFSKHHLAKHLASKGHRVLFVEASLGPLSVAKRPRDSWPELREIATGPRQVGERIWATRHFNPVPYHSASPLTAGREANRLGQRILGPLVRRDMFRLGMQNPVLIAGLPHAVDLLPHLPRQLLVYHCADDYVHVKGFPASLPELEEELCRASDLVVATAEPLAESRSLWNPNTHWIPNGVSFEHFAKPAEPHPELSSKRKPVIGFVGGLAQWVDLTWVAHAARQRPDWSFVLIGPRSTDLSPVEGLPNVDVPGPRPYGEVPSYLAAFDVAIVPFVQDEVTRNADPIKVYEYLAAGVPVVATRLQALERLSHVVRLAGSPQGFLTELDAAVAEGRETRAVERRAEAQKHTWAARFDEFERLVLEALP